MLRDQRRHLVHVHDILGALLERTAQDDPELLRRHADRLERRDDDVSVELGAVRDQLERRFEVVEKAVDVGEEDRHIAAGSQELGDLDGGDKVAAVRAAGGRGAWSRYCQRCLRVVNNSSPNSSCRLTPVDLRVSPLVEDLLDDLLVQDLGEILCNERESLV